VPAESGAVAAQEPVGAAPRVSVVVPTRDRPEQLARCLASVRASLRDGDELMVVDSASVRRAEVAEAGGRYADVVLRAEQPGVDRARNLGWRGARHEVVLFTDDDVTVDAGWAGAFAAAFARHPDAGFVTGRIEVPPGEPFPRREIALKRETEPQVFDRGSVVNLGHGASMATRRPVLEHVGGWDEALGAGGHFGSAPEVDLFDRILAAGWVGRYEPTALAFHEQWRDMDEIVQLDYRYGVGNGARIAKLARSDRPRARRVAANAFWHWGLATAVDQWRAGDRRLAKATTYRVMGNAAGLFRGLLTPVEDGHYRPRRDR
jgi:glycosyltransferase involved in cell wall biosynthesis